MVSRHYGILLPQWDEFKERFALWQFFGAATGISLSLIEDFKAVKKLSPFQGFLSEHRQ